MTCAKRIALFFLLGMLAGCAGTGNEQTATKSDGQDGFVNLGSGICQQTNNGLLWQIGKSSKYSTGQEAKQYAEDLELGGYTDWRLPTRDELYMLHYITSLKKDSSCKMKLSGSYWSGKPGQEAMSGKWESYPLCGGVEFKYLKMEDGYVRAVRP